MLVKCFDNNKVKSPCNWVIYPLTQPQVANNNKKNGHSNDLKTLLHLAKSTTTSTLETISFEENCFKAQTSKSQIVYFLSSIK